MTRDSEASSKRAESLELGESAIDPTLVETAGAGRLAETLVEAASEAFVLVDESGEIRFANPAISDVLGYEPDAIVGDRLLEIVPERLRDAYLDGFTTYLRTGERTRDWESVELPGQHREGHEVPLLISFREVSHDGDRYFLGIARDFTGHVDHRDQLSTERAFVDSMFDALPDVVYAFDRNGEFLRWNERANEVTGYTDGEIASLEPLDLIPESDHERVAASISRVFEEGAVVTIESRLVTKDGTEIPYEFTGAPLVEDGEIIGETGVGRDVTERKRREETLERLDELNTVIRSVDRALVEGTTREEIAKAVCDRLVAEGAYRGAVLGTLDREADQFDVDAVTGVDRSAVETLAPSVEDPPRTLARAALDSRSVAVVEAVGDSAVEAWRTDAREQDYDSAAAIPLVADGPAFGVLGVFSDRPAGISDREREVLGELGEAIGNAIQAALTHQLLYSNAVTQIELRSTNTDLAFAALSAEAGCRLQLEDSVTFGEDQVFYFTGAGASAERIIEAASAVSGVSTVDHLGSDDDEHLFELRTREGTMTRVLTDHGARTTAATAESGTVTVVVELPPDAEVRAVVDAVESAYPGTDLVARREVESTHDTPMELRRELTADLTAKQRAALEAAYSAGYFEWPTRTSSAEEVAETLDIASQTFHQHLRIAERKVLSVLFEDGVSESSP